MVMSTNLFSRIFVAVMITFAASTVKADVLFDQECLEDPSNPAPQGNPRASIELFEEQLIYAAYAPTVRTCQDLKLAYKNAKIVWLTLTPALLTFKFLTRGNPAVLMATVLTTQGFVVVYLLVQQTLEDCERMEQARRDEAIYREIEKRYGLDGRHIRVELKR